MEIIRDGHFGLGFFTDNVDKVDEKVERVVWEELELETEWIIVSPGT